MNWIDPKIVEAGDALCYRYAANDRPGSTVIVIIRLI